MTKISDFSAKVHQLCSQIPPGQVTTYKLIALASSGKAFAARAVGTILRKCACKETVFPKDTRSYQCPVNCYRVIKSDFNIGKLIWTTDNGTSRNRIDIKRAKLAQEGVFFDPQGYLRKDLRAKIIFRAFVE